MKLHCTLTLGLTALLGFGNASASPPLAPYTAQYELVRNGSVAGRATITLSRGDQPGLWKLHSRSESTDGLAALAGISIDETSVFRANAQGFDCVHYHYRQSGLRKRERQVRCQSDGIVSNDHKGEYRFPAQNGVLDRQSVSLALSADLKAGKRGELSYAVVDREQIQTHRYRVHGEENTQVPAGNLPALRIDRLRENQDRNTSTWYGLKQNLVPIRIVQTEGDGGNYELRLTSFKSGQ